MIGTRRQPFGGGAHLESMSISSTLRRVAVVGTTVLAGLTLAAPAHAERGVYDDPADASASLTDIRRVTFSHGPRTVFVKVRFADLRARSDAGSASLAVYLDADRGRRGPETVLLTGLQYGTDYQLVGMRRWRTVGEPLDCAHRVALRPAQDVAKVWVSRDCLDDPAEVRVGVRMVDQYDASHPVTDWFQGERRFTPWLQST